MTETRRQLPRAFVVDASVLVKVFLLEPDLALAHLADLLALPLTIITAGALAERALALGLDRGITAYDASYVALAEILSLPLVTADAPLASRFADTPNRVLLLDALA